MEKFKTKHIDKIVLTGEQLEDLHKWDRENNHLYDKSISIPSEVIFCARHEDFGFLPQLGIYIKYNGDIGVAKVKMITDRGRNFENVSTSFDWRMEKMFNGSHIQNFKTGIPLTEDYCEKMIKSTLFSILVFTQYANAFKKDVKKLKKDGGKISFIKKNTSINSFRKRLKRSVVSVSNSKQEGRGDKKRVEGTRSYDRHIESWSVRGHWRSYKSGKTIWIDSHKRGEGELSGKDYTM